MFSLARIYMRKVFEENPRLQAGISVPFHMQPLLIPGIKLGACASSNALLERLIDVKYTIQNATLLCGDQSGRYKGIISFKYSLATELYHLFQYSLVCIPVLQVKYETDEFV